MTKGLKGNRKKFGETDFAIWSTLKGEVEAKIWD